MNRNEVEYVARLAGQIAFGALLMATATVRRRVAKVRDQVFPR